jgi:basic amino acid/polyamine antiporter, APA family
LREEENLRRVMGRWDLAALAINGLIGSAIFGLPAGAARAAGAWSPVATAVCAGIVLLIVLCFAEAAGQFSGTGGPYLYSRAAFGPTVGFAAGWMMWLARITAFAANSNLLVSFAAFFVPALGAGGFRLALLFTVCAALAWTNIRGVRPGALVGDVLAAAKLLPMAGFVVIGLFFVDPSRIDLSVRPTMASFGQAILLYVFAFTGFEYAAIPAGEALRPKKDLPFAMLLSIAAAAALYTGIQTVCVGTLPGLASSRTAMADSASSFLGPAGGTVLAIAATCSILGNLSGMALVSPRLTFALAEEGLLPGPLAAVHREYRTPWVSIVAYLGIAFGLGATGTFEGMLRISAVARIVPYSLTCLSVPVLRRKSGDPGGGFRLPGGALIPLLAAALCAWLLTQSTGVELLAASAALASGYVLFGIARALRRGPAGFQGAARPQDRD